ncbi:hypothetical protein [Paenibacillus polymyxa]|uniref:hypothetical protein n=1 Tax=Paenibacillus polymyxa TaxID=1406 RepID=UPI00287F7F5D|nr:hypothetical protein [Paenibacillus polymyxa]
MITTESMFFDLSDDELRRAFEEYEQWRETGVLEEGVIRNIHRNFEEKNDMTVMVHTLTEPLLYVVIKRLIK